MAVEAVTALSTASSAKFNAKFPAAMPSSYCGQPTNTEVNGIKYYSFSGIGQVTNGLDPSDYLLAFDWGTTLDGESNDGLVSACSSRLGYVIRDDLQIEPFRFIKSSIRLGRHGDSQTLKTRCIAIRLTAWKANL